MPISSMRDPHGMGGFLDPDKVVEEFDIEAGIHIADFGSGAGYFTILLGRKVGSKGKVVALDVQESALDSVKIKVGAAGLENVETIRADLEVVGGSSLDDNSQDMVLMANVLFQSSKKADMIKEAERVLKANGPLIVVDWKLGTGGFGPPDDLRTEEESMKSIVLNENFDLEKKIDAGIFHYGIIFRKKS